jgi:hypothetical protein
VGGSGSVRILAQVFPGIAALAALGRGASVIAEYDALHPRRKPACYAQRQHYFDFFSSVIPMLIGRPIRTRSPL